MFCLQNLFFMVIKMSFLAKHEEYWLWKSPLYVKFVFEAPVFYFLPQLCELMNIICTCTTRVAIIKLFIYSVTYLVKSFDMCKRWSLGIIAQLLSFITQFINPCVVMLQNESLGDIKSSIFASKILGFFIVFSNSTKELNTG